MAHMAHSAPSLDALVLVALLVGAAISAGRLLRRPRPPASGGAYLAGPEADASHLVMNLAMALMLTPWYGRTVLLAVLGLLAVTLAALLARTPRGALAYHLVAALAMLYAVAAGHAVPRVVLVVLAGGFALDAVVTASVVLFAPRAGVRLAGTGGLVVDPGELRIASVPHLVMDVAMVAMLLGMTH
jgi:hypothetical protein